MNRPLARASCRNFCATSFRRSNGSVVLMTNWIGRPWLPGSGGGWNATTCAPAIFGHVLLHDRLQHVPCVRVRWSHGFSTMPAMVWPGTSSWKTWSVSG